MGQSKIWKDNWGQFIASVIHTTLCSQYLDTHLSFLGFPSRVKGAGADSLIASEVGQGASCWSLGVFLVVHQRMGKRNSSAQSL